MRAGAMTAGVVTMVGAESVFLDMLMLAIAGMGMFVSMLLRCFGLGKVKAKT